MQILCLTYLGNVVPNVSHDASPKGTGAHLHLSQTETQANRLNRIRGA